MTIRYLQTKKVNYEKYKKWWFILGLIIISAFLGVFLPIDTTVQDYSNLVAGDTACMLTATALVLLMTPGLAFFAEVWFSPNTLFQPCCKVLLPWEL